MHACHHGHMHTAGECATMHLATRRRAAACSCSVALARITGRIERTSDSARLWKPKESWISASLHIVPRLMQAIHSCPHVMQQEGEEDGCRLDTHKKTACAWSASSWKISQREMLESTNGSAVAEFVDMWCTRAIWRRYVTDSR